MTYVRKKYHNINFSNDQIIRIFGILLTAILIFLLIIKSENDDYIIEESILILVSNLIMAWLCRKNRYLLIVSVLMLYFNYSIIYPNYFVNAHNFFTTEINRITTLKTLDILCLFNSLLLVFSPYKIINTKPNVNYFRSSYILDIGFTYGILLILIIILCTGIKSPSIEGGRSDPSPVYEYSILLFILLFYFVSSKSIRKILFCMAILFAAQNFINGGRVSGIQFLFCVYFCQFSHKLKLKHVFLIALPLFFTLYLIGMVRTAVLSGEFDISNVFTSIIKGGFALDTAYAAYHTSSVYVYMSDKVANHLIFFIALCGAIFIGYGRFPHLVLQTEADKHYPNYNGGIIPYYFWFYLGTIGIFIASFIVSLYFRCINCIAKPNHGLIKCIGVYGACFIFRWYLYTPYSLLRGTLFLTILYYIFRIFSRQDNNKKLTYHPFNSKFMLVDIKNSTN